MGNYYLAIDMGASSVRHILGHVEDGTILLEEVYRFDNKQIRQNGHDCWDLDNLRRGILAGLKVCGELSKIPVTIGIDTWGVDYVLLDKDDNILGEAVAYRDKRTEGAQELVAQVIPDQQLYERTGVQKQVYNTIYQLTAQRREHPQQLEQAESMLLMPDYFNFLLTGVKKQEYSIATSSGLVNAREKTWDRDLIDRLGFPQKLFGEISVPGTVVGELRPEIQKQVGFNARVMLPATHDTGSAYLAVPARDENAVYLSSGTWSLLGVENEAPITSEASRLQDFTNEGGAWYRYLYMRNIMGLWIIQSIRRELNGVAYVEGRKSKHASGRTYSFPDLIALAQQAEHFPSVIDVNHPSFLDPESMIDAVQDYCRQTHQQVPESVGELAQCVYKSLAECYKKAIQGLSQLTGKTYTSINIVGGGCQDMYLNAMTAQATGLPVLAGPVEGAAIGNLMVQMIAGGEFADLQQARDAVKASFQIKEISPNG